MATIAWLSAETPDRHGGGGQRRQFHQIRALIEAGIGVRVATLEGPQDDESVRALAPVERFAPSRLAGLGRPDHVLRRLLDAPDLDGAVVAHVESLPHVQRMLARRGLPVLVDFHNVNSRWHAARGEHRTTSDWRRRERAALRLASLAAACSEEERDALRALGSDTIVEVAGHGIARDEWPDDALADEREPVLSLFGAWRHGPNRDAAKWLATHVWPTVRKEVPAARLVLAGPGEPPPDVVATPGIEFAGRVDALARLLGRVRVVVVPIREGIGARVKFGEALASGAAVVSTSAGAEGFEADGAFVRADEPADFARACVALLRDEQRARLLGFAGRALAFERLGWERTSEPIIRWIESTSSAQGLRARADG